MLPKNASTLRIHEKHIGNDYPTYFIADIAANHDSDLERAKDLIFLAAEAGADAAKFQHFTAETIVSDYGFKALGRQQSHQAGWRKPVFDVYKDASVSLDWTESLFEACRAAGIAFFTSPYSIELVDHIDPYVPAYKIGSGDINWIEIIRHVAKKGKPYILATGASSADDVYRAVAAGLEYNSQLCLMQCNTNYTGSVENMKHIQLNVLKTYHAMFPNLVLGLSDHTPGHATVLGAVALGARAVEKHFTDDVMRVGPDHAFSMDAQSWREMVLRTRELEAALGDGVKRVQENEAETVVLQRRAIRVVHDLPVGHTISNEDLCVLRPAPENSIPPYLLPDVVGCTLRKAKSAGAYLVHTDFA